MHPVDDLALEVLREVPLQLLLLSHLVESLDDVEVLHFRSLHRADLMVCLSDFRHFDHLVSYYQ